MAKNNKEKHDVTHVKVEMTSYGIYMLDGSKFAYPLEIRFRRGRLPVEAEAGLCRKCNQIVSLSPDTLDALAAGHHRPLGTLFFDVECG